MTLLGDTRPVAVLSCSGYKVTTIVDDDADLEALLQSPTGVAFRAALEAARITDAAYAACVAVLFKIDDAINLAHRRNFDTTPEGEACRAAEKAVQTARSELDPLYDRLAAAERREAVDRIVGRESTGELAEIRAAMDRLQPGIDRAIEARTAAHEKLWGLCAAERKARVEARAAVRKADVEREKNVLLLKDVLKVFDGLIRINSW